MTMKVIHDRPPLYADIVAAFPFATKPGVMFCWGDTIYWPVPDRNGVMPPELVAHEQVHCDRQGDDIIGWWRKYIANPIFRRDEEVLAHIAELKAYLKSQKKRWVSQNAMTRHFLERTARRLSDPLYGPMISYESAVMRLKAALEEGNEPQS